MKTLIIYYSNTGSTELISQTLAYHLNADLVKIRDLKKRDGTKNRIISSIDAFRESKTKIKPEKLDLTDYDLIYIGTPTWNGNPTPAIITIIDRCNFKGKDVVLFATMSSNRGDSNLDRLNEKVKIRGGRVIESFTMKTKGKSREQLIKDAETAIEIFDLRMY